MLLFAILSAVYACFAAFVILATAISTCSMQVDVAAICDPTKVLIVIIGLALLYAVLAVWFFRAKLNGVD